MRSAICVFVWAACSLTLAAANNTADTRFLLDQISAKASKVRLKPRRMADHLRKRDANLAMVEVRLQLLEENAEELKRLLAQYETAAQSASPSAKELLGKLRQSVAEINARVDEKQDLFFGTGAEKQRRTLRNKARETVDLSNDVRELTTRLAD